MTSTPHRSGDKPSVRKFRDSFAQSELARALSQLFQGAGPIPGRFVVTALAVEDLASGNEVHGKYHMDNVDWANVRLVVELEPDMTSGAPSKSPDAAPPSSTKVSPGPQPADDVERFVKLVDYLERNAQLPFVGLKYVRDQRLSDSSFVCSSSAEARSAFLREVIADGIVETYRVENPKAPEHPVAAVRLAPHHPRVRAVLEARVEETPRRLVRVTGEPISQDIVRDRR